MAAGRMIQANSGNFVLALGEERPRVATQSAVPNEQQRGVLKSSSQLQNYRRGMVVSVNGGGGDGGGGCGVKQSTMPTEKSNLPAIIKNTTATAGF